MIPHQRFVLLAIVLTAALLALAQINQHLILASDNASYIVLGQALAMGRGYVMINEPMAPPMNLYPFGYPLLLAAVLRLAGAVAAPLQAVVPMKLVAVLFYLGSLPLMYALVKRRHGDLLAALTTTLVAVNSAVVSLAVEILSETPWLFLTLLGLLAVEDADRLPKSRKSRRVVMLLLAGLALVAAYYMRTAGLAILVAAPLYLLLRGRRWTGLALGVLVAALALPWFLRSSAPPTPETPFFARSYIHQVFALAPYSDQTATPLDLAGRVVHNSLTYLTIILPETLFPHLSRLGTLSSPVAAVMAALLVLGFALEVWRGLRPGEIAAAAYWLSLSLFVWVLGFRYIIVLVPFAYLYLLVAGDWLVRQVLLRVGRWRLPANARWLALVVLAAIIAVSGLIVNVRRAERNLRLTRHQTLAQVYAGNAEWTRYLEAAAWLMANSTPDAVVMARKPDLLYLLTGRRTVEYPYTQDSAILLSTIRLNGVSYILEDAFTWTRTTETYLVPAIRGQPASFTVTHETEAPPTRIWRVTVGK